VPGHAAEFFASDNINSPALMRHLQHHGQEYAAILFLPYLYGPILNGLPLVADRACLMPCLHDEAYAYLPPVERIFRQARRILYLSAGEKALAERLYGPGIVTKGVLVGVAPASSMSQLPRGHRGSSAYRVASPGTPSR